MTRSPAVAEGPQERAVSWNLVQAAYDNFGPNPEQIATELSLHFLQSGLITRQYIKSLEKSK